MPVQNYRLEFRLTPNPKATHLRGVAHLDADLTDLQPYLNTVLRGHLFVRQPPSLTIKYLATAPAQLWLYHLNN